MPESNSAPAFFHQRRATQQYDFNRFEEFLAAIWDEKTNEVEAFLDSLNWADEENEFLRFSKGLLGFFQDERDKILEGLSRLKAQIDSCLVRGLASLAQQAERSRVPLSRTSQAHSLRALSFFASKAARSLETLASRAAQALQAAQAVQAIQSERFKSQTETESLETLASLKSEIERVIQPPLFRLQIKSLSPANVASDFLSLFADSVYLTAYKEELKNVEDCLAGIVRLPSKQMVDRIIGIYRLFFPGMLLFGRYNYSQVCEYASEGGLHRMRPLREFPDEVKWETEWLDIRERFKQMNLPFDRVPTRQEIREVCSSRPSLAP